MTDNRFQKIEHEYVSYNELKHSYLDCRKRKRGTQNAMEFELDETVGLTQLYYELNTFNYNIGKSIVFVVHKPKDREVFAADFRDRIIHHLFVNRLNQQLESEFINDSYSCRVGKGTLYGIKRLQQNIEECSENYTKDAYVLKCDLKSFFSTIDKELLYETIKRFIQEKCNFNSYDLLFMTYLLGLIINQEPQNNCIRKQKKYHWKNLPKEKSLFFCPKGKGLPIGNLTSQIFANLLLSSFDHYITDTLGFKRYGRYVDDFYIVHNNKQQLVKIIPKLKNKLEEIQVELHPKKIYLQEVKKGISFIGGIVKPNRRYITNRSKNEFYKKISHFNAVINDYNRNNIEIPCEEIEAIARSINSHLGLMKHFNTYNIRKKILTSKNFELLNEYLYIDKNYLKVTPYEECSLPHSKKRKSRVKL